MLDLLKERLNILLEEKYRIDGAIRELNVLLNKAEKQENEKCLVEMEKVEKSQ